jgi:hypothetical protein
MAKKQYFLIVDTETTVNNTVADFGAVVCDRQGNVVKTCGILVRDHFDAMDLFYTPEAGFWGKQGAVKRREHYVELLNNGTRTMGSVGAINRWLEKVNALYSPELTAYNLPFDVDKCRNTGIDLNMFSSRFCLWAASVGNICKTKKFKQFALENHAFNNVTPHGNMTLKTNAEIVAGFISGVFTEEPHTALEDAIDFELPILANIIKKRDWKEKIEAYSWRDFQVKDNFSAK